MLYREIANNVCRTSARFNDKIKSLAKPLDASFGVDLFSYLEINENGELIHFGTTVETKEFVFHNGYFVGHPFMRAPKCVASGYYFLDFCNDQEYILKQKPVLDKFGIRQFFLVVNSEKNTLKINMFGSTKNQTNSPNVYFNNLNKIHRFIEYFHNESTFVYLSALDYQVNIMTTYNPKFNEISPLCCEPKNRSLPIILSTQEERVLKLLVRGYSASKIAEQLNLSRRTVETYILNMKNKNGCSSKTELVNLAIDSSNSFRLLYE